MGIPTKPPVFRTLDWGALMRHLQGDEYHKPDVAYEFKKGANESRRFNDSGASGGPYSPEDQ